MSLTATPQDHNRAYALSFLSRHFLATAGCPPLPEGFCARRRRLWSTTASLSPREKRSDGFSTANTFRKASIPNIPSEMCFRYKIEIVTFHHQYDRLFSPSCIIPPVIVVSTIYLTTKRNFSSSFLSEKMRKQTHGPLLNLSGRVYSTEHPTSSPELSSRQPSQLLVMATFKPIGKTRQVSNIPFYSRNSEDWR